MAGTPENLEKYCERTGRWRVTGKTTCREAFRDPPPAEAMVAQLGGDLLAELALDDERKDRSRGVNAR
jgi:hypothetical protein